jgi:hypothetical protein
LRQLNNASFEQPSTITGHKEDSHKKQKKTRKKDMDEKRVEKKQRFSGAPAVVTTPPVVTQLRQDNKMFQIVPALPLPTFGFPHADNAAIADMAAGVINNQPRADGVEGADMDFAPERRIDLEKY